jgi:predicted dehydrogenase
MALNVGIVGCGNIAPAYITGCAKFPDQIAVTACADALPERADAFAAKHGLRALSFEALLADPDVHIIINLTVPAAHAEVSARIIEAGKHVYSEKPLALNRGDGKALLDAAARKGVRVGCAPDTFLGGGQQTVRALIDAGAIGRPVSATAFMVGHGPDSWRPNPFFYYLPGGGPMLDMGPYYLTALVNLLGPMKRVAASASRALDLRVAGAEGVRGQPIPVSVNTHSTGVIDFEAGATATVIMSFDVWKKNLPIIEIYGTEGSISVPDPNRFDGDVQVWHIDTQAWETKPHTARTDVQRGIGVADMARAISDGSDHLASGALAYHVLDAMLAFDDSSEQDKHIVLESMVERPPALAL